MGHLHAKEVALQGRTGVMLNYFGALSSDNDGEMLRGRLSILWSLSQVTACLEQL